MGRPSDSCKKLLNFRLRQPNFTYVQSDKCDCRMPVPTARVSVTDQCDRPERRANTTVALGILIALKHNR